MTAKLSLTIKNKPFLLFFFLLLIPFVAYFFRPDFIAMDSYGFLLLTCQNSNVAGISGLPFLLFSALPCNFLVLKGILFLLAFVSGCFVIKLATLFSPENGWKASYFMFLSSVFVLEFAKLENDVFGFVFLFASLYFFFKAMKTEKKPLIGIRTPMGISLLLLIPAAAFWQGTIFFPIAYTLNFVWIAALSIPIIVFFWQQLLGAVIRTRIVAEDLPMKLHSHFVLLLGFLGVVLEPLLLPQAAFFFVLGFLNAKFWILSIPFLTVGMVLLLEKINQPYRDSLNRILIIVAVFAVFGLAQSILLNPPTQDNWQAIDYALEVGDGNINNDWGMGYWVLWKGGNTESFGSFHRQKEFGGRQVAVTMQETTCPILEEIGNIKIVRC